MNPRIFGRICDVKIYLCEHVNSVLICQVWTLKSKHRSRRLYSFYVLYIFLWFWDAILSGTKNVCFKYFYFAQLIRTDVNCKCKKKIIHFLWYHSSSLRGLNACCRVLVRHKVYDKIFSFIPVYYFHLSQEGCLIKVLRKL